MIEKNNIPLQKQVSRASFLSSAGALGIVGTFPFLVACSDKSIQPIIFEGSKQEAVIENIISRRAIRNYQDKQPSQEQIDTILKCAIHAPSSANSQPWEVRVVFNPGILGEINQRWVTAAWNQTHTGLLAGHREPGFSIFYNAPVLIVIAADPKNSKAKIDIGLIMQNIMLSAHALGLGTCPIGALVPTLSAVENRDITDLLNIPDNYEVHANIALGYANEHPEAPIRYSEKVKIIR